MKRIAIAGAGSLGKLVLNIIVSRGEQGAIYGFYDDEKTGDVEGAEIKGDLDDLREIAHGVEPIVAIGDVEKRKELYEDMYEETGAVMFYTAIDRSVHLSQITPNSIGMGSIVKQNAVIEPDAQIGVNCVIGNNSTICHDVEIGNHCRISPGVHICGDAKIGDEVYLCPGVTVDKGVEIEDEVTVLSGTAVYKDLDQKGGKYKQGDLYERIEET